MRYLPALTLPNLTIACRPVPGSGRERTRAQCGLPLQDTAHSGPAPACSAAVLPTPVLYLTPSVVPLGVIIRGGAGSFSLPALGPSKAITTLRQDGGGGTPPGAPSGTTAAQEHPRLGSTLGNALGKIKAGKHNRALELTPSIAKYRGHSLRSALLHLRPALLRPRRINSMSQIISDNEREMGGGER